MFTTPEPNHAFNTNTFPIPEVREHEENLDKDGTSHLELLVQPNSLPCSISMPSFSKTEPFITDDFPTSASAAELFSPKAEEENVMDGADSRVVPVNSHLSSVYASDMFEPFFSSIFNPSPPMPLSEDFSWLGLATYPEVFPFISDSTVPTVLAASPTLETSQEGTMVVTPAPRLAFGDVRQLFVNEVDPPEPELQHYFHTTTFASDHRPPVLLGAMQACGALFVKTRKASEFITKTLAAAREALVQEFAKNPTDSSDQIHLILAVVLLQTIGLFHQQPDQRASSSIYHGMLVMRFQMIRRTGMIAKNASWEPTHLPDASVELLWKNWVEHEMTKSIYFALPSSYHPSEIELNLPCEDALWKAATATEWFSVLQGPSVYGLTKSRLTGINMLQTLGTLSETHLLEVHIPINPFSHFVLIHAILRHLFVTCVEGRLPRGDVVATVSANDVVNQEIYRLQYALHNWLQNWLNAPELPKVNDVNEEPPFIYNALPFYWLGQVSLLAFQESLPPFEQDSPNNLKVEVRFRLVKQWLRHIRGFLKKGDQVPTLFWDELMKLRLQTWQQEFEGGEEDDQDGLLGFKTLDVLFSRARVTNLGVVLLILFAVLSFLCNIRFLYFHRPSGHTDSSALLSTISRDPAVRNLNHLIVVPGHAIWKGTNPELRLREDQWVLEPYQMGGGRVSAFFAHIFRGGQTRAASTATEAESYMRLALAADVFHTGSAPFLRATTEDHALDSYQNLLFSIARFHEYSGRYPTKITVVGYEFKRARFTELHRAALRWPLANFHYIGVDPDTESPAVKEGEASLISALSYRLVTNISLATKWIQSLLQGFVWVPFLSLDETATKEPLYPFSFVLSIIS
ncbi:hypothetical protein H0H92_002310 [Tricholoma furcatifolium]|nr:hypothetical protein H0H92_002310 [Tricholoma furcatifolium]